MLLDLAQWLAKDVRLFNVFSYLTLRAVLMSALFVSGALLFVIGTQVVLTLPTPAG